MHVACRERGEAVFVRTVAAVLPAFGGLEHLPRHRQPAYRSHEGLEFFQRRHAPTRRARFHREFPLVEPAVLGAVLVVILVAIAESRFEVEVFGHPGLFPDNYRLVGLAVTIVREGAVGNFRRRFRR